MQHVGDVVGRFPLGLLLQLRKLHFERSKVRISLDSPPQNQNFWFASTVVKCELESESESRSDAGIVAFNFEILL